MTLQWRASVFSMTEHKTIYNMGKLFTPVQEEDASF